MARATETEEGPRSAQALNVIGVNIDMACNNESPICQDTGWATFELKTPIGANQIAMKREIRAAVADATKRGQAPSELGRFTHWRELRRQPRPRHADHAL